MLECKPNVVGVEVDKVRDKSSRIYIARNEMGRPIFGAVNGYFYWRGDG